MIQILPTFCSSTLPAVLSPLSLATNQLKGCFLARWDGSAADQGVRQIAVWAARCASLPESAGKHNREDDERVIEGPLRNVSCFHFLFYSHYIFSDTTTIKTINL